MVIGFITMRLSCPMVATARQAEIDLGIFTGLEEALEAG
jgi:hypothetical protein